MRVLVTGGGGFLGAAIVRALLQRGVGVRNLARGDYPWLASAGVEPIRGDVADVEVVARACEGMDAVFHVAALPGIWGKEEVFEATNIGGTQNILDGCRAAGVPHLIYSSSPSVVHREGGIEGADESLPYPTHWPAPYPRTKAEAERRVLAANCAALLTVSLRPHLIWGPGDPNLLPRLVDRTLSGRLKKIGGGDPLIDSVYITNAADAHLLAWDRLREGADIGGKVYFITNGEPVGCWTFINKLLATQGVGPLKGQVSRPMALRAASLMEWVWRTFSLRGEPPLTQFVVEELTCPHYFDISAARRDLGYTPRISIEEGLRLLALHHQQSGKSASTTSF